jgi:membrane protease YdiL (CAAX protease family)
LDYYTRAGENCQKEIPTAILFEALILYLVLFLPGTLSGGDLPEFIEFSALRELSRLLLYSLPAFALVWRFLLLARNLKDWDAAKPRFRDFRAFFLALPGLLGIGLLISLVSPSLFQGAPIPRLEAPANALGWIILAGSSLGTGYLEESYFRFYLLNRLEETGLGKRRRIFISVMLFSFCHLYEGPGGAINALLAGFLLSLIFVREKSLHGIAWAHGVYNLLVYALGV